MTLTQIEREIHKLQDVRGAKAAALEVAERTRHEQTKERGRLNAARHLDGDARAQRALAALEHRAAVTAREIEDLTALLPQVDARIATLDAARAQAARVALDAHLAGIERERNEQIDAVKTHADPEPEELDHIVATARAAYSLAHDLLHITGDRRYFRNWDIRERLGTDLAAATPTLRYHPHQQHEHTVAPWAAELAVLREAHARRSAA